MCLNEDQLKEFCNGYCKFAEHKNTYIRAAKNCATGEALQELIDYAESKLATHCNECLLKKRGKKVWMNYVI